MTTTTEESLATRAHRIWDTFTESERHGAALGMFPASKMPPVHDHALTIALMELKRDLDTAAAGKCG